nr:J22 [uncultured bacterium]
MIALTPLRPSATQIATTAALGAFVAALVVRPAPLPEDFYALVEGLAGILTPMIAALFGALAARAGQGRTRLGWWLMSAGWFSWGLGQLLWSYFEATNGNTPFPSLADPAYLGFVPLVFAGILVLAAPSTGPQRLRSGLDMLMVLIAVATLFQHLIVAEMLSHSDLPLWTRTLMIAYPVGDALLLVAVAIALYSDLRRTDGPVLVLLMLGLVMFLVADIGFSRDIADGIYVTGSSIALGWFFGFVLFARAAFLQMKQPRIKEVAEPPREWQYGWKQLLAAVLLVPTLVVLTTTEPSLSSAVLAVAFGVAVLVRRVVAIADGIELNRNLVAMHSELMKSHAEVEKQSAQLATLLRLEEDRARTDGLTGVRNRAAIDELLRRLDTGPRDLKSAVVLVDVDNLKSVNDRLGHLTGDRLLRAVARALADEGVVVGRFGGDEFLVLIPDAGVLEARTYLTRMHRLLQGTDISLDPSETLTIQVSAGYAIFPDDARVSGVLVGIADERMYAEKRAKVANARVYQSGAA